MSKTELERHISVKIILTEGLNNRLGEIAKHLHCRKSDIVRSLLVNGLKNTYREI